MKVPLTVSDFLRRGALVYPDRPALIDEPGTAGTLGTITYRSLERRARAVAIALDQLGVGPGERVAIVSPNAARFLISFFGVSGYGRVLVPINFRLNADEVSYIVEHSGAIGAARRPRVGRRRWRDVQAKHRIVLDGAADAAAVRCGRPTPSRARWEPDEDATASINYTSGTTARPEGRAADPPQLLAERRDLRLAHGGHRPRRLPAHAADVPLQRLGHAVRGHRHGRAAVVAAQDRRRGDPAADRRARRDADVRGARRSSPRSSTPPRPAGAAGCRSRAGRGADRGRRRAAAVEDDRAGRDRARLGVHPDLRPDRDVAAARRSTGAAAEWDGLDAGRARPGCSPGRARRRSACAIRVDERRRGAGPVEPRLRRLLGAAGGDGEGARATGGSTPATAATSTATATCRSPTARRTSSSPAARTSARSRSRTASTSTPPWPRSRSSAFPTRSGARAVKALVVLRARRDGHRGRADRASAGPARPLQVPDVGRVPRRAGPDRDRQAAEVQAARAPTGRARPPGQFGPAPERAGSVWARLGLVLSCPPAVGIDGGRQGREDQVGPDLAGQAERRQPGQQILLGARQREDWRRRWSARRGRPRRPRAR